MKFLGSLAWNGWSLWWKKMVPALLAGIRGPVSVKQYAPTTVAGAEPSPVAAPSSAGRERLFWPTTCCSRPNDGISIAASSVRIESAGPYYSGDGGDQRKRD